MASAVRNNLPFPKNYSSEMLCLDHGEGVYLVDADNRRYLDFGAGIAVNALGYGRADLADIAATQMRKLIHVSNLFATEPSLRLAGTILRDAEAFLGVPYAAVHFGNSGSEANEAAVKYARVFAKRTRGAGHHKILVLSNGFHGRTLGALSLTPSKKYQEPFAPLVPGVESIEHNDVDALTRTLDSTFAAVFVEVVQGEGGLAVLSTDFVHALNDLCKRHGVLLVADEVQTGLGRAGEFFASTAVGLRPDILTLSKPLAGGLPLSATLIPESVNEVLHVGDHGTTFGGGPVTTAVALSVWEQLRDPNMHAAIRGAAATLDDELTRLADAHPCVEGVAGLGLLCGLVIDDPDRAKEVLPACRERGLLVLRSGARVVRIAPPLTISEVEIKDGCRILGDALTALAGG